MSNSVRPLDGSPSASPIPGILQARTLEWVAISFSSAWKWKVKVKSLSRVRLFTTPWTAAHQAPLSMGFSRQGYWSGVPLPSLYKPLGIAKKKSYMSPKNIRYKFKRRCMCAQLLSRARLLATPWTAAYQAPLSIGFSRQEYWSGVPLPSLYIIIQL